MSEADIPVRRGRRDPELALQIEQAQIISGQDDQEDTEYEPNEYGVIAQGKITYRIAKSSYNANTQDSIWHTLSFKDSVAPDESPVDTARRVYGFVHAVMEEAIEEQNEIIREQYEQARRRPIGQPRQSR